MYLVDYNIFNKFITNKGLADKQLPINSHNGSIIEYVNEGILIAKIEVYSFAELKFFRKYANKGGVVMSKNKFWIRGNEWKNGIQELNLYYG